MDVSDHRSDVDAEEVDCQEAVHVLYHYLDGELTEERRTLITSHLDRCHPCLDAFEFEVELRQVIAMKCREEVPSSFRLRIAQVLAAESRSSGTPGAPPSL